MKLMKCLAVLLSVVMLCTLICIPVSASNDDVAPAYEIAKMVISDLSISSGTANCTSTCSGYSIERFVPYGSTWTMKYVKTHCVLRGRANVPYTNYTDTPFSDGSCSQIGGGATFVTEIAASYYISGKEAVKTETTKVTNAASYYSEATGSVQTTSAITAFGNVQYCNYYTTIAGYYQSTNY